MSKLAKGMTLKKEMVLTIMRFPESYGRTGLKKIGGFGLDKIFAYVFKDTILLTLESDKNELKNWCLISPEEYENLQDKGDEREQFEVCLSILTGAWQELDDDEQMQVLSGNTVSKKFPL